MIKQATMSEVRQKGEQSMGDSAMQSRQQRLNLFPSIETVGDVNFLQPKCEMSDDEHPMMETLIRWVRASDKGMMMTLNKVDSCESVFKRFSEMFDENFLLNKPADVEINYHKSFLQEKQLCAKSFEGKRRLFWMF